MDFNTQLPILLTATLYHGLADEYEDDNWSAKTRTKLFFSAVNNLIDYDESPTSIDDIDDITLDELKLVLTILKSTRHESFKEERIKNLVHGIDAIARYDTTAEDTSNKRKRTD